MCWCIDYDYEGLPRRAEFGYAISELPVRLRGGRVVMALWGAQGRRFYDKPDVSVIWSDDC